MIEFSDAHHNAVSFSRLVPQEHELEEKCPYPRISPVELPF
jgi:hypothetical protein